MCYSSGIQIGFSQNLYFGAESSDIPVRVRKTETQLARPVLLKVQPLTIEDALAMGLDIPLVQGDNITVNDTRDRIPNSCQSKR